MRTTDAKILFFIEGTTPTAAEAIAIAATEGNVGVRSALNSPNYGARLETCDYVAGTPPTAYLSAYPFYNGSLGRVAVSNNLGMPCSLATLVTPIQEFRTTHMSGPAGYDVIDLFYLNGYLGTDQESNGFYDFYVESGIEINGETYTALEAGTYDPKPLVPLAFGLAQMRMSELYIPPLTEFTVVTRREAADAATAEAFVTGATQANPVVLTFAAGHSYLSGQNITILAGTVVGMTQLNGNTYQVNNPTGTTLELRSTGGVNVNGTGFGAYTSGGTARRNYSNIFSAGGVGQRQDGMIQSAVLTDTHMRGNYARGYRAGRMVVNASGVGTSIPVTRQGLGITGGLNLQSYYGAYGFGAGVPASEYAGTGAGSGGFGNTSGGVATSVSIGSGGTGHSAISPPEMRLSGTGTLPTGFGGGATSSYGPQLITGKPRKPVDSIIMVTDSYTGFGSSDGSGSRYGSHGWFDRMMIGKAGVHKLGVSGETAVGFMQNNTKMLGMLQQMIATGYAPNIGGVFVCVNDFGTNNNTNVVSATQGAVAGVANWLKTNAGVSKILIQECTPETDSSDSFATVGNQTVRQVGGNSNNFGPLVDGDLTKGRVLQYNAKLPALAATIGNCEVMPLGSLVRDVTVPWAWRTDMYAPTIAATASTGDGTHPLTTSGLAYIVRNMPMPALMNPARYAKPTYTFDSTNGLFWFDPTDDSYLVQRKSAAITLGDKFGNTGRRLEQYHRAKRPLTTGLIAGKRALKLDGANGYMQVENKFDYAAATGFTLFAVVQFDDVTGTQAILSHNITSSTTTRGWTLQKLTSTNLLQFVQSTDGVNTATHEETVISNQALAINTPYVIAVNFSTAGLTKLYCNSDTPLTLTTPGTFTSLFQCAGDICVGAQQSAAAVGSLFLNGKVGDVMAFNASLSNARMTEMIATLKAKYGIA